MTISQTLKDFISLISSQALQDELWPAKIVFIFFTVAFLTTIIYFMFTSSFTKHKFLMDLRGFFDFESAGMRKMAKRWKRIQARLSVESEYEYKLAIMEAEDLFNEVLKDKGFAGKTIEERIGQVKKIQLPNPEEVIDAHKTRNLVAHDPNYRITKEEAKKVLESFEKGIRSIESF